MLPILVAVILVHLLSTCVGQEADTNWPTWRREQVNHRVITYNGTSLRRLCQMSSIRRINLHLDYILIPRPVGTENHKRVGTYIEQTLQVLGYAIEHDRFTERTVSGIRTFRNIIATLDPAAPRRLTLACHYDSKEMRSKFGFDFMGATDSAFPCAMLLDVAQTLAPFIANREARNVTLQLLFLDGEEAFDDWTTSDSLYGSRHLADLWQNRPYPSYSTQINEINRIDLLVLLDLLGAVGVNIPNYVTINDQKAYMAFLDTELQLRQITNCLDTFPPNSGTIFRGREESFIVEDDELPFYRRGVPIMHMIPLPFPLVWHTRLDDRTALNEGTMTNLATIVRVFTARYLAIRL